MIITIPLCENTTPSVTDINKGVITLKYLGSKFAPELVDFVQGKELLRFARMAPSKLIALNRIV